MAGTNKSAEKTIENLTRECRLQDVKPALERFLRALVGYEVVIDDISGLDSDDLLERGSGVICLYRWLYLPSRIRYYRSKEQNRRRYYLMVIAAAAALDLNSFPRIHGHPEYSTCGDIVGMETLKLNLFQILEWIRILHGAKKMWPGVLRLVDRGIESEYRNGPPATSGEQLLYELARSPLNGSVKTQSDFYRQCRDCIGTSKYAFETAEILREINIPEAPDLRRILIPPVSFLSDFLFPGHVSPPPSDRLIFDMKEQASRKKRKRTDTTRKAILPEGCSKKNPIEEHRGEQDEVSAAVLVYDEWCQAENDYYRDHCFVRELTVNAEDLLPFPRDITDEISRTRKIFEYLKPTLVKKEKYLPTGEEINLDLLLRYLTERREMQTSTVVRDGLAIPHIVINAENAHRMILVRARTGIIFPGDKLVHIAFVLVGSVARRGRNLHLKDLVAIAHTTQDLEFDKKWLEAKNENGLKVSFF